MHHLVKHLSITLRLQTKETAAQELLTNSKSRPNAFHIFASVPHSLNDTMIIKNPQWELQWEVAMVHRLVGICHWQTEVGELLTFFKGSKGRRKWSQLRILQDFTDFLFSPKMPGTPEVGIRPSFPSCRCCLHLCSTHARTPARTWNDGTPTDGFTAYFSQLANLPSFILICSSDSTTSGPYLERCALLTSF